MPTLIKATEELTRNINIISEKEFNMKIPELYEARVNELSNASVVQHENTRIIP